jgi:hypothetical protein
MGFGPQRRGQGKNTKKGVLIAAAGSRTQALAVLNNRTRPLRYGVISEEKEELALVTLLKRDTAKLTKLNPIY